MTVIEIRAARDRIADAYDAALAPSPEALALKAELAEWNKLADEAAAAESYAEATA